MEYSSQTLTIVQGHLQNRDAASSNFRNQAFVKQDRKDWLTCKICHKPLSLGSDTVADENGQSVHDECQVQQIIQMSRTDPSLLPHTN
jgi:hypothetical protein